jgi:hypothetical protein
MGDYNSTNWFSGGLYLLEAGRAGLLCFATDERNGYEVRIDSDADSIALLRWIDGNAYTLASVSVTIDVLTGYFVGVQRSGSELYLFWRNAADRLPLFSTDNLAVFVNDSTYLAGRIGFTHYGSDARYFTVRAGLNPRIEEFSDTTDPLGHLHATGETWAVAGGVASRATFDTETVTQVELARVVKGLIDDLTADGLLR